MMRVHVLCKLQIIVRGRNYWRIRERYNACLDIPRATGDQATVFFLKENDD